MKTHYEVLNLEKNCTAKEIKDSFIKLSKKFHPDLNKSSDAHKRFVEVNEAYSVLGNSSSRHRYDATLSGPSVFKEKPVNHNVYSAADLRTPYEFYSDMYARQRSKYNGDRGTYFTTSKLKLVVFCCLVMVFGSSLQMVAETRKRARRSHDIARAVRDARERRQRMGAEERLRELAEGLSKK